MVVWKHVSWLNDKGAVKYSEQRHKTHTLESQHSYLNEFPIGSFIWLISLPDGPDIGTINAYVDYYNMVADMGIMIGDKSFWGKGYGKEAWVAVMDFLQSKNIRKIECGCMRTNSAMRRLALASNMIEEGSRKSHFILDGEQEDLVMYRLIFDDE